MPKVRKAELSLLYAKHHVHFYQVSSKYSEGYSSYRVDKKSISNKTNGDNSKTKKELSFLYKTCCLVLFYISTKYHKNIPRVFDLQSQHKINQ